MAAYGINRANREKRDMADAAAKRTIALEPGAPVALPLLYGYFRQDLVPVYTAAADGFTLFGTPAELAEAWVWDMSSQSSSDFVRSIGQLAGRILSEKGLPVDKGKAAVLVVQSDISANEIYAVIDLAIDGTFIRNRNVTVVESDDFKERLSGLESYSYHILQSPGVAGTAIQMATN